MPDYTAAQNAALDAYNDAARRLNDAAAKLDEFKNLPPEQQIGTTRTHLETDVRAAQQEAATASNKYAALMEQQATEEARQSDPGAQARANRAQEMANYYKARADGFAAKDAAAQQAAQTRADAALQRATTAAGRVDAQNDLNNAQAELDRANTAKAEATTPTEVALAQTQINKANNDISIARAKLPGELAETQARTGLTTAQTNVQDAQAALFELQAKQLAENDPLVKAHLQAQIDQLQAQTAGLNKPTLEQGFANAAQIPMIVKDDAGKWSVEWVANQGQQMTSRAALQGLADTMSLNLGDGPDQIPLQTAKDLFSIAHQVYSDQTQRMQETNVGAQIGAGLLQNRAAQVTGQQNTLLNLAGSKNFGLGGPLPSGLWAGVQNEIMGNVTALGGGQSTYDTAAALVHAADPSLAGTPAGAGHTAVVQQMLDASRPAAPAPAQTSFAAPTTTIAPDGTVTIAHAPQAADLRGGTDWLFNSPASPISNPANTSSSFQAPQAAFAQSGIPEGTSRG